MKHYFQGCRRLPASLGHQLQQLTKRISGAERREKQRLMRQLAALRAEYNVLKHETAKRHQHLCLENRGLKVLQEEMKAERDDLQLEIWELEDLIEELFELMTAVDVSQPPPEWVVPRETVLETPALVAPQSKVSPKNTAVVEISVECAAVDLSAIKLALVGGHDSTRRAVIQELSQRYGLAKWVELPPFRKHSLGRSNIKAKIHDCDPIVLITGYMKHKQTDSIMQLRKLGTLPGDVLLLNCRGKSGVVREILTYISQKNC